MTWTGYKIPTIHTSKQLFEIPLTDPHSNMRFSFLAIVIASTAFMSVKAQCTDDPATCYVNSDCCDAICIVSTSGLFADSTRDLWFDIERHLRLIIWFQLLVSKHPERRACNDGE
jgi:hypothetical protein